MTRLFAIMLIVAGCYGCTQKEFANTWVHCPCTVESIGKEGDEYYITAHSNEDHAEYISFYTTHLYSIGDTIK